MGERKVEKKIHECYAPHVRDFLEENWTSFVESLSENYDDDAEGIAEEIVKSLG
ncbi:hypothetical protein [Tatumella sp. UCD-D_suzukii]|uniref:hypothetical protein n=1 Tax=Tatumella sp. UCD-D_suzukii TaxID=1408192 RepID=UPI000ACE6DD1|nr:hypothetical protein [Tatumella sp. UCD-D_suzukii]